MIAFGLDEAAVELSKLGVAFREGHREELELLATTAFNERTADEVVDRLHDHPERAYVFGGALAATLKGQRRPSVKLETLLIHAGLINAWLDAHPEREWALQLIEIPVVELFAARGSLPRIKRQACVPS